MGMNQLGGLHLTHAALGAGLTVVAILLAGRQRVSLAWGLPLTAATIATVEVRTRGGFALTHHAGLLTAAVVACTLAAMTLAVLPRRAGPYAALLVAASAAGALLALPDTEIATAALASATVLAGVTFAVKQETITTFPPLALLPLLTLVCWAILAPGAPESAAATSLAGFGLLLTTGFVVRALHASGDRAHLDHVLRTVAILQCIVAPITARIGVRRPLPSPLIFASAILAAATAVLTLAALVRNRQR
ncbi:MAG: hypothetical protein N2037_05730 [Acidimicrobiales bacterium]|nr:hypothetical protein [Acidimicrobiales bacterium]